MKKEKKLLVVIILLLVIIIGIISVILITLKNNMEIFDEGKLATEELKEDFVEEQVNNELRHVTNINNYYTVQNCVNNFYEYYSTINENAQIVYNILDKDYINYKNITTNNIQTILPQIKNVVVNITNMYVSEQTEKFSLYYLEGYLREKIGGKISNFKIMVKLDSSNGTFSIILQDYILNKYKNLTIGTSFVMDGDTSIQENTYNKYTYKSISEETYIIDIFGKFKEEILYNPKAVYERLDEQYKNEKFNSFEKFNTYAKENTKRNVIMKLEKYEKKQEDTYTRYICVDQYENYYVFKETSPMNYTLLLDTYTIDLPEFIEKYNKASDLEKVGYNIQKCITAINNKDYSYVYGKLDNTFKQNNFKTEEIFKDYIINNLYEHNEVLNNTKVSNEGNIYIYNLNIKNPNNENEQKNMQIIMKLEENTNFTMSFNIQ